MMVVPYYINNMSVYRLLYIVAIYEHFSTNVICIYKLLLFASACCTVGVCSVLTDLHGLEEISSRYYPR